MSHFYNDNIIDKKKVKAFTEKNKPIFKKTIFTFVLSTTLGFILSGYIIYLLEDCSPLDLNFIQTSPSEVFLNSLKLALLFALYFTLPVILYQYTKLKSNTELKKTFKNILIGSLLFALGGIFALKILIPLSLYIFLGLNAGLADIRITISNYIGFCLAQILITGIIFLIPYIIYIKPKSNILNPYRLGLYRNKIWIIAFITAFVIISPIEIMSLGFLASIIAGLYYFMVFLTEKFKNKH